jgi:8-oxo-dGTP pyrophosphatase MutT (NUDIX family)
VIKHATAGAFLFNQDSAGQWRLGLIEHPRLKRWMSPGGHVDADESPFQAAVREVEEETGLTGLRLLEPPSPRLPPGFPQTHVRVPPPWWIIEASVAADGYADEAHIHLDYQYVAVVDDATAVRAGEHPLAWYVSDQLAGLAMFEDNRLVATMLFSSIATLSMT